MRASTKIFANTLAIQYGARLDGERLRRLVEAKSVGDAMKMLGDYGFGYEPDASVDGFVVAETNKLIEFISETAPTDRAADALIAPFVYNNAKLGYKSRFVDIPADSYYVSDVDVSKIARGDYSDCDAFLEEALVSLDGESEKRPQRIDVVITRAMYKYVLSCGIGIIKKYFRTEIDLKNILSAARIFRLGIPPARADEFIEGGTLSKSSLEEAASGKNFSHCFYGTPYEDIAERLESSKFVELGAFERESDDFLFELTDSLCANMCSYEPFLNYYTRARIELKTIKTALVCIKTSSRDEFYARIPTIYR